MNRREIREQTIVQLKSSGVEIPAHLPLLEADSELSPKNGDDVARKNSRTWNGDWHGVRRRSCGSY